MAAGRPNWIAIIGRVSLCERPLRAAAASLGRHIYELRHFVAVVVHVGRPTRIRSWIYRALDALIVVAKGGGAAAPGARVCSCVFTVVARPARELTIVVLAKPNGL